MASGFIATASSEQCLDGIIVDCDDPEAQASTMTENVDRVETAPSGDEITASIPTSGRSPPIHPTYGHEDAMSSPEKPVEV
ncbi:hypothetical protein ONZ45_g19250 [Pleurotus djamor]|nr:hypothetical protein ONZ45_g19250 [Pleurotus djamor]